MRKFLPIVIVFSAICVLLLALNFTLIAAPAAAFNSATSMRNGVEISDNSTTRQIYLSQAQLGCPPCSSESGVQGSQSEPSEGPGTPGAYAFPGWFGAQGGMKPNFGGFGTQGAYAFPGWFGAQGGMKPNFAGPRAQGAYAFPGWFGTQGGMSSQPGDTTSPDETDTEDTQSPQEEDNNFPGWYGGGMKMQPGGGFGFARSYAFPGWYAFGGGMRSRFGGPGFQGQSAFPGWFGSECSHKSQTQEAPPAPSPSDAETNA